MGEPEWSDWIPFAEAIAAAPKVPGVYMAREGEHGQIIYIGMAGERRGGGSPKGIRGRLTTYASGKALASGLGEAVFDRALADADWLRARLASLETDGPLRAKYWGVEAFRRADLHVRWTTTANRASAAELEDRLVREAGGTLWNRASVRAAEYAALVAAMVGIAADPVADAPSDTATDAVTQPITDEDLRRNQIRIPLRFRMLLPADKQRGLEVSLCGQSVACSWDPRTGPERIRSGVLRFPANVLHSTVTPGQRLKVGVHSRGIELS